jgi:hypothetical protein
MFPVLHNEGVCTEDMGSGYIAPSAPQLCIKANDQFHALAALTRQETTPDTHCKDQWGPKYFWVPHSEKSQASTENRNPIPWSSCCTDWAIGSRNLMQFRNVSAYPRGTNMLIRILEC